MSTYALSGKNMHEIFLDCLCENSGDSSNDGIRVVGYMTILTFDPKKLSTNKERIDLMYQEMPDVLLKKFYWDILFPDGCYERKDGTIWTKLNFQADQLFQLGVAVGKIDITS